MNNEQNTPSPSTPLSQYPTAGDPLPHENSDFTPKHIPSDNEQESGGVAVLDRVKETAKDRSHELLNKASSHAKEQGDNALDKASTQTRNLQRAVGSAGDRLNENQPEPVRQGVDLLSNGLDRVASYLEQKDSKEVADDIRNTVRDHPVAVTGGLLLFGFLAGRMLRVGDSAKAPTA